MVCEAEFTPLTRCMSRPKECLGRGKYLDRSASASEQARRPAVSRVAKPENYGRHVWVSAPVGPSSNRLNANSICQRDRYHSKIRTRGCVAASREDNNVLGDFQSLRLGTHLLLTGFATTCPARANCRNCVGRLNRLPCCEYGTKA